MADLPYLCRITRQSAPDAVDGSPPTCGNIAGLSWKESRDG